MRPSLARTRAACFAKSSTINRSARAFTQLHPRLSLSASARASPPPFHISSARIVNRLHTTSSVRSQLATAAQHESPHEAQNHVTRQDEEVTRFQQLADLGMVHENIVRAVVDDMRLETMTEVQSKTINQALRGDDVVAQAKTGTGKTLGFLLPILHRMLQTDPQLAKTGYRRSRTTPDDIRAIIISPTRELAEQIAVEARKLTRHTSIVVQTAVGGTQKREKLREMQRDGCHLLVGTPGRLQDIFSDQYSRVSAPGLEALVLDEADRLLDQGFWKEIERFIQILPNRRDKDRQTLMFSATMPREVQDLISETMKPDFRVVQSVQETEVPTHERVPQRKVALRGLENAVPALYELCAREIAKAIHSPGIRPFKAIVFCNANKEVALNVAIFRGLRSSKDSQDGFSANPLSPARLYEMHSRLSQAQRDRACEAFRRCESGILFSSDVTARGMDFPDVTHVIQMGIPTNREQYIHRLGRTARAGKEGEGWLLTDALENDESRHRLRGMRLQTDNSLSAATADLSSEIDSLPPQTAEIITQIRNSAKAIDRLDKVDAFKAMLGTHGFIHRKEDLIESLNTLSKTIWAMESPPRISAVLANKLNLGRARNLAIGEEDYSSRDQDPHGSSFGRSQGRSFGSRNGSFRSGDRASSRFADSRNTYSSRMSAFPRSDGYSGAGGRNGGERGGFRREGREGRERGSFGASRY